MQAPKGNRRTLASSFRLDLPFGGMGTYMYFAKLSSLF